MKILFATSECAPYSKSGGLADVAASLPSALIEAGNEVAVITPLYQCVRDRYWDEMSFVTQRTIKLGDTEQYCGLYKTKKKGVTVWFVENDMLFRRPKLYGYDDDKYRFAFFSRAIIELLQDLDFMPEILHCNDWETAPAVIYLKNDQNWRNDLQGIKTVFTIHNIAYQGQFGEIEIGRTFGLPWGWYEGGLAYEFEGRRDINLMKGAMLMADAVSTVSPTYARELHVPEYGMGLQGVCDMVENKFYGILNGIDVKHFDPSTDNVIKSNFTVSRMAGKDKCKEYIQKYFGLETQTKWPLLCSVARLNEQKGIELIKEVLPGLMDMGVQLIVFGQGEQHYIDYFEWAKEQWPGQLGFSSDYSEEVASQIFAGADFYLMPSRFEPCGLSQMMAMRYGTVPIVHETGGLKDSVRPYSDFDGVGDGFSFINYSGKALYQAVLSAIKVYFGQEDVFKTLRKRCMKKDFSWKKSADEYMRMYGDIYEDYGDGEELTFEDAFANLKEEYFKLDAEHRAKYQGQFDKDYHRVVEMQITGRGAGVFYIEITADELKVEPYAYDGADAKVAASYENLMGFVKGTVNSDKLFINGQLKVTGNISKSLDLRSILGRYDDDTEILRRKLH